MPSPHQCSRNPQFGLIVRSLLMTRRGLWVLLAAAVRMLAFGVQLDESSQCYGIVPELHNDTTAIATAEMISKLTLESLPVWLAFDCKQSLRNFVCLTRFGPLVEMEDGETFSKCTSVCDRVADKCEQFLKQAGPAIASAVDLESCADTTNCTAGNYDVAFEEDEPQCAKPLVVPDRDDPTNPIPGSGCALPCLSFMFNDEEWDGFLGAFNFFTYFGFAAGVYMVFSSAYNWYRADDDRKVGAGFVWLFSVGCTLSATGAFALVISGTKDHLCFGNATASLREDTVCMTQGYLYLVGTMVVIGSSVCQCVDLYLRVVVNARKATLAWFQKVYAVLVPTLIVYAVAIVAGSDSMGYEPNVNIPSCFIVTDKNDWATYAAYFGPSLAGYSLCWFLMIHCLVKMNQVFSENKAATARGSTAERSSIGQIRGMQKFIRYNIRPILFIISVTFVGLFPAGMKFYYEDINNIMVHSSQEFITCLMKNGMNDPKEAEHECGDVPDIRPAYEVIATSVMLVCGIGLIPLFIYGIKYPECGIFKGWSSTSNNTPGASSVNKRFGTGAGSSGQGVGRASNSSATPSSSYGQPASPVGTAVQMVDIDHASDLKQASVV